MHHQYLLFLYAEHMHIAFYISEPLEGLAGTNNTLLIWIHLSVPLSTENGQLILGWVCTLEKISFSFSGAVSL